MFFCCFAMFLFFCRFFFLAMGFCVFCSGSFSFFFWIFLRWSLFFVQVVVIFALGFVCCCFCMWLFFNRRCFFLFFHCFSHSFFEYCFFKEFFERGFVEKGFFFQREFF